MRVRVQVHESVDIVNDRLVADFTFNISGTEIQLQAFQLPPNDDMTRMANYTLTIALLDGGAISKRVPMPAIPPALQCPHCGGYVRGHQWIGRDDCSVNNVEWDQIAG